MFILDPVVWFPGSSGDGFQFVRVEGDVAVETDEVLGSQWARGGDYVLYLNGGRLGIN